jgi:tetratricopeptide (TPR) repeat protein
MTPRSYPHGRAARRRAFFAVVALVTLAALVSACGWNPSKPFERDAPTVKEAVALLEADGGDAKAATALLADYLTTGPCAEGNIGTPRRLHERPNASFDLGLALFRVAEAFGHRFGDEEATAQGGAPAMVGSEDGPGKGASAGYVECAMKIVRAVADDALQPVDLRARALYLQGNLLFLDGKYKEAVEAYDRALELVPGMSDTGPFAAKDAGARWTVDALGRDAAWNRAIALRREEDKKDAGQPDSGSGDGGKNDDKQDGGKNDKPDAGKNDRPDGGKGEPDKNKDKDDDADGGSPPPAPPPSKADAGVPPPPSRASQDDRILDQLEAAPTVQQELARRQQQQQRRVRPSGMADK